MKFTAWFPNGQARQRIEQDALLTTKLSFPADYTPAVCVRAETPDQAFDALASAGLGMVLTPGDKPTVSGALKCVQVSHVLFPPEGGLLKTCSTQWTPT